MDERDLERVMEIAHELDAAGRTRDAELLALLVGQFSAAFEPDLPDEELDRRLEAAEADIAAGRLTPAAVVWEQIEAARRSVAVGP